MKVISDSRPEDGGGMPLLKHQYSSTKYMLSHFRGIFLIKHLCYDSPDFITDNRCNKRSLRYSEAIMTNMFHLLHTVEVQMHIFIYISVTCSII
jgi:hypothetical protein